MDESEGPKKSGAGIQRIVLLGFMGAGKSTVGPLVAERIGWRFEDLDALIEAEEGRSLPEIFGEGEPAFRRLESRIAQRCLRQSELVLSVGGGWPAQPGHMDSLDSSSVSVWLRVPLEVALARIESCGVPRPLLDIDDPQPAARRLFADRNPHYAPSSIRIETEARLPDDVAREVVERVGALSAKSAIDSKR